MHRSAGPSSWARFISSSAVVAAAMLVGLSWPTQADNWPAWRGDGSGISTEKSIPTQWDAQTNILWKTAIPGAGNSSPVIWDDRLYLTTTLDGGKTRLVLCYDAAAGQEIWRRKFDVAKPAGTYSKNGYASHTSVTDGRRVYAFFDEPGLVALDARTGDVDWQLPLGPFKQGGYFATSPVLTGNLLIMVCDVNESIFKGEKHKGGFIVAVDKTTGAEKWRQFRKPAWNAASPIVIDVGGKKQVIVSGDPVVSYDAATGEEIWSCAGMKSMCAPSPVFDGSSIWVASGRNGPAMLIDPTGKGDVTETHATLLADTGGPYVCSPLVYPFLMLPGDDGQVSIVDKAGQLLARTRIPAHFSASPIAADGRIYWPDEAGRTWVLDAARLAANNFRNARISTNDLGEPILASPAIARGRLYLRSTTHLYCIAGLARTTPPSTAPAVPPQATLAQLEERYKKFMAAEEGPDIAVRLQVVDELSTLDDPGAIPLLQSILQKDNHWDVSEAAAKAIAGRRPPAADALIAMLDDKREFLKIISAEALGEMKMVKAAAKLATLAADKNRFVRLAALRALGRIGLATDSDSKVIFPALLAGLSDPESPVKLAAIRALAGCSANAADYRQQIVQSLQARTTDKNLAVAKAATEALAIAYKTQTPAALPKQ